MITEKILSHYCGSDRSVDGTELLLEVEILILCMTHDPNSNVAND